jgi:type IV pilus assembly protein PilA
MQSPMPYPQQPFPPQKKGTSIWVVLAIILGCVVIFGGILVVLAISGVRSYLQAAKSAEALSSVGAIARDAASSYSSEDPQTLCASASQPIPASLSSVAGKKYQSSTTEWSRDASANAGFACLHFEMDMPQYYQYDYKTSGSPSRRAVGDGFRASAKGDLDGNGTASDFSLSGRITAPGTLVVDTTLTQVNPKE